MKYRGGQTIHLGDRVQLWEDRFGTIVCIIADELFSDEFLQADWAFLQKGLLIKMDDGQLIHYPEIDEDLILLPSQ